MRNINPNFSRGKDLVLSLVLSKQLQVFFQLLSSAHQADDRHLVYWSLVHSLASYGWGVANKAQKFSCYWGNTCHPVTRDRKMKEMTKDLIAKQMKLLSGQTAVITIVYDNYQRGQHLKYQREGSSSGYVKGTHQLANKVRLWKGTEYDTKFVEMDYVNQAIPSLPGLPAFENVNITSPLAVSEQLVFSNMMEPEYAVDFTGKRVESYLKLGVIADIVVQMWRSFTPENVYPGSGVFDDGRIESLHKLVTSKSVKDLFDGAKNFRDSVTKCWNPSVGEVTMQLMLGLCGLAEESAKQCGAITLDQLWIMRMVRGSSRRIGRIVECICLETARQLKTMPSSTETWETFPSHLMNRRFWLILSWMPCLLLCNCLGTGTQDLLCYKQSILCSIVAFWNRFRKLLVGRISIFKHLVATSRHVAWLVLLRMN